ncbi:MAG: bifunctional phosphopantothenoylcysteine decarboxylase/phosphopantothenate--cysteine ligase CoaBC [Verrucomicrobiota bacterium]
MSRILFILSGSIACYKACDAISQLVQRGHAVRTVATEAALKFVGAATLEGLTHERVAVDTFEAGRALEHIDLTRWAEVVVVCPATANTLNRMAAGLGDDLAGALLLAHDWKKPLLLAPAMNPAMWHHPATRASVARLREWGARFIAPGAGRTACGEVGEGRLAESDEIVAQIEAALTAPTRRLRVLVTSGGTAEPIDGVRVIANTSTGATGALIAEYFSQRGHDVTLLRARSAVAAPGVREVEFFTFAELDVALAKVLGEADFDAVIHAAAVSDFAVESIEVGGMAQVPGAAKLASGEAPVLRLRKNRKLLDGLRSLSRNRYVRVVGFKLTNGASAAETQAAVTAMATSGAVDFVVHNDLAQRAGAGGQFPAAIWSGEGEPLERCAGRAELAEALERLLVGAEARANAQPGCVGAAMD